LGYSSKPKTTKMGLCKELEGHIFDYGGLGAADTMRVTQEKIQHYVISRLDMYRTNVLMYRTMVLLVRPTKVRR
jgi:hypothetical protein